MIVRQSHPELGRGAGAHSGKLVIDGEQLELQDIPEVQRGTVTEISQLAVVPDGDAAVPFIDREEAFRLDLLERA